MRNRSQIKSVQIDGRTYTVSNEGRVWRDNGIECAQINNGLGYFRVKFGDRSVLVHRIVWETFVGPVPPEMDIDHIDHNKENNALTNLQVISRSANSARYHEYRRSIGKKHKAGAKPVGPEKASEIRRLHASGVKTMDIARQFGVCRGCVLHIVNRRNYKEAA